MSDHRKTHHTLPLHNHLADPYATDQPYGTRCHGRDTLSSADRGAQVQLEIAAAAGLLALVVATVLAVYKPRGMTAYGWRK